MDVNKRDNYDDRLSALLKRKKAAEKNLEKFKGPNFLKLLQNIELEIKQLNSVKSPKIVKEEFVANSIFEKPLKAKLQKSAVRNKTEFNAIKVPRNQANSTKREFELPGQQDLNKDQDRVLRLEEDGQFLIVGGPGTGKSVVALLRAKKYQSRADYQFLVYNHVLNAATNQLADTGLKSWTLQSWLWIQLFRIFSWDTPKDIKDNKKADYKTILNFLQDENKYNYKESSLHIIIDEGQDAPKDLYDTLWHMGIVNFFVVADQNQQITEDHSSRKELENILGIDTNNVIELTKNYRNSDRIATFAQHFYTDPSSPPPEIPYEKSSLDTPTLYEYNDKNLTAKLILRHYDKDVKKLIGVITNNTLTREVFTKLLNSIDINLDNQRATVSTYFSDSENRLVDYNYQKRDYRDSYNDSFVTVSPKVGHKSVDINFSEGGIVVLTDKSVKGLEFDIVFIVIDDFNINTSDLDTMRKRFYVMSSRAKDKLILLKAKEYRGDIEKILPKDENILKRELLK